MKTLKLLALAACSPFLGVQEDKEKNRQRPLPPGAGSGAGPRAHASCRPTRRPRAGPPAADTADGSISTRPTHENEADPSR